ncbi:type II toxin-antitoxin system RelE/ParE family toxin [Rhodanobacter sp. C01]|uniref:type II toxin-antitoxin system RelE/ParE family toxin n=1 Tax=Rhodanobacter sp. C01 TaxID=1945856 RepID=UPI00098739F7|nr:type II toxin-antitoxin system RelE/ParE family toxin [Rhodanobacter sp. C01]OOG48982.1 plasmid stabilization protein [Rhodanobacter sp. C01]
MTFKIRFTEEALADLERLYDFALAREDGDWTTAERALDAIRNGLGLLASSPFSCRKAAPDDTFLRELIIAFGASGYVALFEIDDAKTVTVLAVRHQREDDYH